MIAEAIVEYLKNLPSTSSIIATFGNIVFGENLFAYADVEMPHDIIWVYGFHRGSVDTKDTQVYEARATVNVRSFNYGKAIKTCREIASDLNGQTLEHDNYSLLFIAYSLEPNPVHLDVLGRMVYSIDFYVEFR